MKYIAVCLLVVLGIAPSFCSIFFDDFDGDSLKSHWGINKGEFNLSDWEYSVEDSWLNVWNVWGPYDSGNSVRLYSYGGTFPKQNDFDVKARVAWDQGEFQALGLSVGVLDIFINMGYSVRPGEQPKIVANFQNFGGGSSSIPAPSSGIHEFRITRVGALLTAYFNGVPFHQGNDTQGFYLGNIAFSFVGPKGYGNPQFAPLYVDWVAVVPEPSTIAACGFGFICLVFKNRTQEKGDIL